MLKKLFIATACVLYLCSLSVTFAAQRDPILDKLIGKYVGSYTVTSNMKRGLTLTVYWQDGRYEAAFEFYGLPGRAKSEKGKYFMTISYDESKNAYLLDGFEWVDRPGNYVFADLIGTLDSNIFSGDVFLDINNPKNSIGTFYVKKVD